MKETKRTYIIDMSSDYRDKNKCMDEAYYIYIHDLISGMSENAIAKEIYAHAVIYYILIRFANKGYRFIDNILHHCDPIDLEDGGDKWYRKIIYEIIWLIMPSK